MSSKQDKKKNTILIVVMIVLAIITVWYVLRSRSPQSNVYSVEELLTGTTEQSTVKSEQLPPAEIFKDNLGDDRRFDSLQDYRQEKLKVDKVGKKNPFESFH